MTAIISSFTCPVVTCLQWDIAAGLSVAAMVVPQGLAYASLALVPSVFGLYAAFAPPLVYFLFGTCRHLSVGPVSVTSVLISSGLAKVFPDNPNVDNPNKPVDPAFQDNYNHAAIQVAFLVGCYYTLIGLLRLGWVVNVLVSPATMSGFITGAVITISLTQVKYILGIKIPHTNGLVQTLKLIFTNLSGFSWREFSMGMSFILVLLVIQYVAIKVKRLAFVRSLGPLLVCILSIAIMNIGECCMHGIGYHCSLYSAPKAILFRECCMQSSHCRIFLDVQVNFMRCPQLLPPPQPRLALLHRSLLPPPSRPSELSPKAYRRSLAPGGCLYTTCGNR